MNTDLDGPADTRVMRIVHSALRRDLARARYQLVTSRLRLRQAAGVLGDGDIQATNALLQAPAQR